MPDDRSRSRAPARALTARLARALGTSEPAAAHLLSVLEARLGRRSTRVRVAGLLLATSRGRRLLPASLRTRAVEAVVFRLVAEHADTAVLLGRQEPGEPACRGLGR